LILHNQRMVPVSKDKTNAVRHALERQDTLEIKGTQNEDNSITREGDLETMCNLGEGIYEDGLMKGRQVGWEEGRKEGKLELALELLKDGMALDKVANYRKLSLSIIEELAKKNKLI
jgi:predicted transposase/invertase (TIGR01784 family)